MRIAIITTQGITSLFKSWPEYLLARALADRGHEVVAYTYFDAKSPLLGQREEYLDGVTVRRVSFNRFWISSELRRWIHSERAPDVVHIHHLRNALAYWSARWFRAVGSAIVHSPLGMLHDPYLVVDRDDPLAAPIKKGDVYFTFLSAVKAMATSGRMLRHLYNYYMHAALLLAHRIVVVSRHDGNVLASLGLPDALVKWVPLWVNTKEPASEYPLGDAWPRPIVLYVGQLKRRKGFDLLVRAIPYLLKVYPRSSFVFVSHYGAGAKELENLASQLGVLGHVRILGAVTEEQKAALMRSADVFVLPTRYEGFGLPVLEAMVQGCPVVSTDVPAVNELIQHEWNGLLARPNDPASLAVAIDRVLMDQNIRRQLVDNGRDWVKRNFSEEAVLPNLLEVYKEAMAARGRH
jgi:glycosyltransferase involved in cell wall biosynthesis